MSDFADSIERLVTHEIADAISSGNAQQLALAVDVLIRSAAVVSVCGVGRSERTLSDLLESASQHLFEEAARLNVAAQRLHAQNGGGV